MGFLFSGFGLNFTKGTHWHFGGKEWIFIPWNTSLWVTAACWIPQPSRPKTLSTQQFSLEKALLPPFRPWDGNVPRFYWIQCTVISSVLFSHLALSFINSPFIKLFSSCPISMHHTCIVKTQWDTKSVGDNNLTRSILQELLILKDSEENLE